MARLTWAISTSSILPFLNSLERQDETLVDVKRCFVKIIWRILHQLERSQTCSNQFLIRQRFVTLIAMC